jgi:hypothetical protein
MPSFATNNMFKEQQSAKINDLSTPAILRRAVARTDDKSTSIAYKLNKGATGHQKLKQSANLTPFGMKNLFKKHKENQVNINISPFAMKNLFKNQQYEITVPDNLTASPYTMKNLFKQHQNKHVDSTASPFSMKNLFKQHNHEHNAGNLNASPFTISNLFKASIAEPDDKSSPIANNEVNMIEDDSGLEESFSNTDDIQNMESNEFHLQLAEKGVDNKTTEIVENLKIVEKEIILNDVQNMKNIEIKHPVVSTRGAKKHFLTKNDAEETINISQEEVKTTRGSRGVKRIENDDFDSVDPVRRAAVRGKKQDKVEEPVESRSRLAHEKAATVETTKTRTKKIEAAEIVEVAKRVGRKKAQDTNDDEELENVIIKNKKQLTKKFLIENAEEITEAKKSAKRVKKAAVEVVVEESVQVVEEPKKKGGRKPANRAKAKELDQSEGMEVAAVEPMVKVTKKIEKDTFEKPKAPTRGRQKATKVQKEEQKEVSQVTTRSRAAAQKL